MIRPSQPSLLLSDLRDAVAAWLFPGWTSGLNRGNFLQRKLRILWQLRRCAGLLDGFERQFPITPFGLAKAFFHPCSPSYWRLIPGGGLSVKKSSLYSEVIAIYRDILNFQCYIALATLKRYQCHVESSDECWGLGGLSVNKKPCDECKWVWEWVEQNPFDPFWTPGSLPFALQISFVWTSMKSKALTKILPQSWCRSTQKAMVWHFVFMKLIVACMHTAHRRLSISARKNLRNHWVLDHKSSLRQLEYFSLETPWIASSHDISHVRGPERWSVPDYVTPLPLPPPTGSNP